MFFAPSISNLLISVICHLECAFIDEYHKIMHPISQLKSIKPLKFFALTPHFWVYFFQKEFVNKLASKFVSGLKIKIIYWHAEKTLRLKSKTIFHIL